jgi:hypothetical protein
MVQGTQTSGGLKICPRGEGILGIGMPGKETMHGRLWLEWIESSRSRRWWPDIGENERARMALFDMLKARHAHAG